MRLITVGVIAIALTAVEPSFAAQGRGRGKHAQAEEQNEPSSSHVAVEIGKTDQRIIREWFAQPNNVKGLPPGLAKKESLPPGLQKQLVRNGQLPPGLQKKIQPMPVALEERLAPCPEGTKRVVINGSIVLFDQRKNVVLDIMAAF
jgi:hypothetical protein